MPTERDFELRLAEAMRAEDPVAAISAIARDDSYPAVLREGAAAADPSGIRLAALLIAKLRFERLVQGCREAHELSELNPRRFTEMFREYHYDTPMSALFPAEETALFRQWRAKKRTRRLIPSGLKQED